MKMEELFAKELNVVELNGSEKTWIGGVYCPPMFRGDEGHYLFTRCILSTEAEGKEIQTVTLKETNSSYSCRYWTNIPDFWDNHAVVVKEAPETLWEYEHCWEAFEHESILDEWLNDNAYNYWDDGCDRSERELEILYEEYAEREKQECSEIPFDEWIKKPILTKNE